MSESYRKKHESRQSADWLVDADGTPLGLIGPEGKIYQPVIAETSPGGGITLNAGERPISVGESPGYLRTITGTATFAGGNTMIDMGQPITGASIVVTPQTGAAGIDYTADATPHVSTGSWVPVYGGNVTVASSIKIDGAITAFRVRPITDGADIDYVVTAPGSDYMATDAITFVEGNHLLTLPVAMTGVTVHVVDVTGAVGVDYTADATPNVSTGNWTPLYGGNFIGNDSATIGAKITGLRFRPIAAGAAATYLVRR